MRFSFRWPSAEAAPEPEEFFVGGWNATDSLTIECSRAVTGRPVHLVEADNWFLIGSRSPLHPTQPGLVHARCAGSEGCGGAVAFRGYLLDPPCHSWSPSAAVLQYWLHSPSSYHNGVFATARIRDDGRALELISDALGIAPLYYRVWGGTVLFATHPRYLSSHSDSPDLLAWRCLIQSGFLCGDRSLSAEIARVPPGQVLRITQAGMTRSGWFDYTDLADGSRAVDTQAVADVEASFQTALDRCLALPAQEHVLALSGGFDSRRILAGLMAREASFQALTVRVRQQGTQYRDLDAHGTGEMARDFGFRHRVLELPGPADYARDDRLRRRRLDAESQLHTWALPLCRALPARPSILFEGLGGDVLGDSNGPVPGLGTPDLHTVGSDKLVLFTKMTVCSVFDRILRSRAWPAAADVRSALLDYLRRLPPGSNQADLAFLLLRTRRSVALWSQQLLPTGHLAVYPYLDLDYLKTALQYDPLHKIRVSFQDLCLRAYWPRYHPYPGNEPISSDIPPGSSSQMDRLALACVRQLENEICAAGAQNELYRLLTTRACVQTWGASRSERLVLRSKWWLPKILELVARQAMSQPCWALVGR